jgi:hypothetical protein
MVEPLTSAFSSTLSISGYELNGSSLLEQTWIPQHGLQVTATKRWSVLPVPLPTMSEPTFWTTSPSHFVYVD